MLYVGFVFQALEKSLKDEGALVKTGIFNDLSNFARFIDLSIIIWQKANCLLHKKSLSVRLYYSQ